MIERELGNWKDFIEVMLRKKFLRQSTNSKNPLSRFLI